MLERLLTPITVCSRRQEVSGRLERGVVEGRKGRREAKEKRRRPRRAEDDDNDHGDNVSPYSAQGEGEREEDPRGSREEHPKVRPYASIVPSLSSAT